MRFDFVFIFPVHLTPLETSRVIIQNMKKNRQPIHIDTYKCMLAIIEAVRITQPYRCTNIKVVQRSTVCLNFRISSFKLKKTPLMNVNMEFKSIESWRINLPHKLTFNKQLLFKTFASKQLELWNKLLYLSNLKVEIPYFAYRPYVAYLGWKL